MLSDIEWLLQRKPQATEAEIAIFKERVSIIVDDPNPNYQTLNRARGLALEAINHDYGN